MKTLQAIAFIGLMLLFTAAVMESVGVDDEFIKWSAFIGTCATAIFGGLFLLIKMKRETNKDRL